MKKKIWAMLLLCVFMLSMVSCGSNTAALNDVQVEMQNENRTLDEANQITAELSYPIFSDHSSDGKADNMLAELNAQIQNNILQVQMSMLLSFRMTQIGLPNIIREI